MRYARSIPIAMLALLTALAFHASPQSATADGSCITDDSPFLRLGWELDSTPSELPVWFEENRVQGHTDILVVLYDEDARSRHDEAPVRNVGRENDCGERRETRDRRSFTLPEMPAHARMVV